MTDHRRDPIQYAREQLEAAGLILKDGHLELGTPPGGKEVWRVDVEGAKRGKKPGWYIAELVRLKDGTEAVVGAFGVWSGDSNQAQKFKIDGSSRFSSEDQKSIRARQAAIAKAQEKAREESARDAAERAKEIWSKLPDAGGSPYLDRKKIRAFGIRFGRDGALAVPVRNSAGVLRGIQFIQPDGSKKFLTGTAKAGSWHLIGTVVDEQPLVLAEGYATGASIHMATGWPVVVCFDCNNLMVVGKIIKQLYPSNTLIFAGDDDHHRSNNPGRSHAAAAAKWLRAKVVFPVFKDALDRTDFNDLHVEQGLDVVGEQIRASVTPTVQVGEAVGDEEGGGWRRELILGREGLKAMTHNAILVIENHPVLKGMFAYDQFAKRVVKRMVTPWGGEVGPLRDRDEIELAAWFGRRDAYGISMPTICAREALIAVAERHTFHPVREYLNQLKWDGTPRIEMLFQDHFGVVDGPVPRAFAKNFMISAVARIYRPGVKADCMLVLEGEQGIRKSTFIAKLCGEQWYADVGTSPSDKDFYQAIQGRWLVELSELASFNRADNAHIKRALSVQVDVFRPSYGRNAESFARECVFFGTVNNQDWQRDETGGRRYMPLWVKEVNLEAIMELRDQLWAEAKVRFDKGDAWWELPPEATEAQDDRYVEDVWAEPVLAYLDGTSGLVGRRNVVTVAQVLSNALEVDPKKQDRALQTRVGNLLRRMGWKRFEVKRGGVKIREYRRPEKLANGEKP